MARVNVETIGNSRVSINTPTSEVRHASQVDFDPVGEFDGTVQEVIGEIIEDLSLESGVASETASAFDVIQSTFEIARAIDAEELDRVIGINTTAVSVGGEMAVKTSGELENPSWSWNPGNPIYVSDTGQLSQTVGTHVKQVAYAWSATKIYIEIQPTFRIE